MSQDLDRQHYREDGRPKQRYETRVFAVRVRRQMRAKGQKGVQVYRCEYCAGWHLGKGYSARNTSTKEV